MTTLDAPPVHDPQVLDALRNERWDFRTPHGIAAEIAADEADVEDVLQRLEAAGVVRRSAIPDPKGRKLYTVKEKPLTPGESYGLLRNFLAKSVR